METIRDIWGFVEGSLLPHWPFIVGYFLFVFTGQFMKAQVWTRERASTKGKHQKFFHFMRRTLAMHAPVTGLLVGIIPSIPASPGVEGMGATALYWLGIGVSASFTFHAGSELLRKKTGVDLEKSIEEAVNPSMSPDEPDA